MKILFFGTPDFAIPCLKMLKEENYDIPAVVTQPDRKSGRGHKVNPTPVKSVALEMGIPVYQPESIKNGELSELLFETQPDMIVVVAYGKILPKEILDYPKYGCVNIHASLLPKLRGAAPINRAVMEGHTEGGITIMYMDAGIDTGDIILQRSIPITENMTAGEYHDAMAALGGQMILEYLSLAL